MPINIPVKQNEKLEALLERVQKDEALNQLWRCANVNAVNRLHMSDHGYVHVKIVANLSLKLLRLLVDAGIETGIAKDHGMAREDAEVVVVLASLLHDVGLAIHWDNHEVYSVFIANERLPSLLEGLYDKDSGSPRSCTRSSRMAARPGVSRWKPASSRLPTPWT